MNSRSCQELRDGNRVSIVELLEVRKTVQYTELS